MSAQYNFYMINYDNLLQCNMMMVTECKEYMGRVKRAITIVNNVHKDV